MISLFQYFKARKILARYLTDGGLEQVLLGSKGEFTDLKNAKIGFVLIALRENSQQEINQTMSEVTQLAIEFGAVVDVQVSSLVIVFFGWPQQNTDKTISFADALRKFGVRLKAIYGIEDGFLGNLGGNGRFSFSFIVPSFQKSLRALMNLRLGQIKQLGSKGSGLTGR